MPLLRACMHEFGEPGLRSGCAGNAGCASLCPSNGCDISPTQCAETFCKGLFAPYQPQEARYYGRGEDGGPDGCSRWWICEVVRGSFASLGALLGLSDSSRPTMWLSASRPGVVAERRMAGIHSPTIAHSSLRQIAVVRSIHVCISVFTPKYTNPHYNQTQPTTRRYRSLIDGRISLPHVEISGAYALE